MNEEKKLYLISDTLHVFLSNEDHLTKRREKSTWIILQIAWTNVYLAYRNK